MHGKLPKYLPKIMLNKKVEVIPIIIGATGIVEKGIQRTSIPGKHNLYNLQRSAILGTAHILRKVINQARLKVQKQPTM